jgi:integrase
VKGETTVPQQGHIFKKGSTWFLRYRDNFLVDGKIVRKQKCVQLAEVSDKYRRESDLADLVAEKLAGVRAASKCPQSAGSFADYVETVWLPHIQSTRKPSSYAGYRSYFLRYIKPFAEKENYAVRDFNVAIVSSLLKDVASMYKVNEDTILKIHSVLSGIFRYALATGAFPGKSAADNPCTGALLPKGKPKQETKAATREAVKVILSHLAEQGMTLERTAVGIAAFTGCRPAEIRGLRWEEWDRTAAQIQVVRNVWHAVEGTLKTIESNACVAVTSELRQILLDLHKSQGSPISGYILARADGGRVNLDNMAKRDIVPSLNRCAACHEMESEHAKADHQFSRDEKLPRWTGWYSLRRFHGTQIRKESGNSDTMAKALRNSKEVADRHYNKQTEVLPDVRRAVNAAMTGLIQ